MSSILGWRSEFFLGFLMLDFFFFQINVVYVLFYQVAWFHSCIKHMIYIIGVRAVFCQGGGNPFAQKILASCSNFYKTVERKLGPCNKIGRTGIWKWLDTVFQSQYLPSLSKNYVATNEHLEKIATTVVFIDKEGNLSWSGLQWHGSCHSNEMTPLPIVIAAIFLTWNCSHKIVQGSSFLQ